MTENDETVSDPEVVENAERRARSRAVRVEDAVDDLAARTFSAGNYPTTSEEIAEEYGTQEIDLANETETLGDVLDRLPDERYESEAEVREAVYGELSGQAGGRHEYDEGRELDSDPVDEDPSR
ncbi:DUF5789 family protein [Natronorarus salvus]|uniref:DUF5789 family protein n=1 Tax=Natronorarus salvus TaxID=3117733 RepID=UPI002F267C2F